MDNKKNDILKLNDLVFISDGTEYNEYVDSKKDMIDNEYLENNLFKIVELDLINRDEKRNFNFYQAILQDMNTGKNLKYYLNQNNLIRTHSINDYVYIEDCSNYTNYMINDNSVEKLSEEYLENTKFKVIDIDYIENDIYECTLLDEKLNKVLDLTIENGYLIEENFYNEYRKVKEV